MSNKGTILELHRNRALIMTGIATLSLLKEGRICL